MAEDYAIKAQYNYEAVSPLQSRQLCLSWRCCSQPESASCGSVVVRTGAIHLPSAWCERPRPLLRLHRV